MPDPHHLSPLTSPGTLHPPFREVAMFTYSSAWIRYLTILSLISALPGTAQSIAGREFVFIPASAEQEVDGVRVAVRNAKPLQDPERFGFRSSELPSSYRDDRWLSGLLSEKEGGARFFYPFTRYDGIGSPVVLLSIRNGSPYALSLEHARITMTLEDGRDIAALLEWAQLLQLADWFENRFNETMIEEVRSRRSPDPEMLQARIPCGFYRYALNLRQEKWTLASRVRSLPPGEEIAVVAVFPMEQREVPPGALWITNLTLSERDNRSRPLDLVFPMAVDSVTMQWDRSTKRWKETSRRSVALPQAPRRPAGPDPRPNLTAFRGRSSDSCPEAQIALAEGFWRLPGPPTTADGRGSQRFLLLGPAGRYQIVRHVSREGLDRLETWAEALELGEWRIRQGQSSLLLCMQSSQTVLDKPFGDGCGSYRLGADQLAWQQLEPAHSFVLAKVSAREVPSDLLNPRPLPPVAHLDPGIASSAQPPVETSTAPSSSSRNAGQLTSEAAQGAVDIWTRRVGCLNGCTVRVIGVRDQPGSSSAEVDLEIRGLPNPRGSNRGSVFDPNNPPRMVLGPPRFSGRKSATFRRYNDGRWVFWELYILELDAKWRPAIPVP